MKIWVDRVIQDLNMELSNGEDKIFTQVNKTK